MSTSITSLQFRSSRAVAPVGAHRLTAHKIANRDAFAMIEASYGEGATEFRVDMILCEGTVIDTGNHRLRVLDTPGHTSGCISLLEEHTGLLITGDLVLAGRHRRDLGVHSNLITDPILDLIERGFITGRHKTLHPGKVVASFCISSRRLYDFLDDNALFEFRPIEYVADPAVVAQNYKMASLTQAFAIDLTGQVCADQFQGEFYSGVSTQLDFHRGAARSPEGKPIVCLRSTTDDATQSRIRPRLLEGEGVTLARPDVHYVVTEYGIAYLFGKSVRERAMALIEIAHPDFRETLLDEAKRQSLVPAAHRLASRRSYLVEEERVVTLKSGRKVMLRPARASDAQNMQIMFHRMSSEDVYMRFFRRVSALTYEEAQRLCNVDFEKDVAFVAVIGSREDEEIVGTGAYFLNFSTNLAEMAYMIVPEWQRLGLGSALQQRLKKYAVDHGVRGFVAELLRTNTSMFNLANRLGNVQITTEEEDDTYHITWPFTARDGLAA